MEALATKIYEQALDLPIEERLLLIDKLLQSANLPTRERVCSHPRSWTKLDSKTRRCLTSKFPYGVLYRIQGQSIHIMAIMNLHRKPGYWKSR